MGESGPEHIEGLHSQLIKFDYDTLRKILRRAQSMLPVLDHGMQNLIAIDLRANLWMMRWKAVHDCLQSKNFWVTNPFWYILVLNEQYCLEFPYFFYGNYKIVCISSTHYSDTTGTIGNYTIKRPILFQFCLLNGGNGRGL